MDTADILARRWLTSVLDRHGLKIPDGRPLHRYVFEPKEFDELAHILRRAFTRETENTKRYVSAAFCLFVSRWFQRHGGAGAWSWDGPAGEIDLSSTHSVRADLTRIGLDYWRRPLRCRDDGHRQFLVSLILEGGLPIPVLALGGKWLGGYIEAVIKSLERGHDRSLDAALRHAEWHKRRVPEAFQDKALIALAAELAEAIVELRLRAAKRPVSVDPLAWLDMDKPAWRQNLPVQIDDRAVLGLVIGLVSERTAVQDTPTLVERVLRIGTGQEVEFGLRFARGARVDEATLGGSLVSNLGQVVRARLAPTGMFAEATSGVPAILETVETDKEVDWRIRTILPDERRTIWGVALDTEASVSALSEGKTLGAFVLPGGQRISSEVSAFRPIEELAGMRCSEFTLVSTGSAKAAAERLVVVAPLEWDSRLDVRSGEASKLAQTTSHQLFLIQGEVVFSSPDGPRYVYKTGSDCEDAQQVEIFGKRFHAFDATVSVFAGVVEFYLRSADGHSRKIPNDSIRIRHVRGAGRWQTFEPAAIPNGLIDAFIDVEGRHADRLRFGHVPAGARISHRQAGNGEGTIYLEQLGFPQPEISHLGDESRVDVTCDNVRDLCNISISSRTALPSHVETELRWPEGGAMLVQLPILAKQIGIYSSDRRMIENRSSLSVGALRGANVVATGAGRLVAELVDPGKAASSALTREWSFERALPLSCVLPELECLFAMSAELDAEIRLTAEIGFIEGVRIQVRRFDWALKPLSDGQFSFDKTRIKLDEAAAKNSIIVARQISDILAQESVLYHIGGDDGTCLSQVFHVPDKLGPWLVYIKKEGRIASRPTLIGGDFVGDIAALSHLSQLMMISDHKQRRYSIAEKFELISIGGERQLADELISLIRLVAGELPLQTFDVLGALPHHGGAAVTLLVSASADVRPTILAIENELPLSWTWLPVELWLNGFESERCRQRKELRSYGLEHLVDSWTTSILGELARFEPRLTPHIALISYRLGLKWNDSQLRGVSEFIQYLSVPLPALTGIASAQFSTLADECFARNDGRQWPSRPNFRDSIHELPAKNGKMSGYAHSVLDAPFVAARLATGQLEWSLHHERMLRRCREFDRTYFDGVFPIALMIDQVSLWQS